MEMIKKKLLTSLVELSDGEEDYMKVEERQDSIALVKKYENLFKEANKKNISIGKQGEILKRFKDEYEFFIALV